MAGATNFAAWAAALSLALASGCGGNLPEAAGVAPDAGVQASQAPLLNLMADAPKKIVFSGTRRYEAHAPAGGVGQTLIYVEEVFADGTGQIAVSPQDVVQPPMAPADEALFFLTQKLRERMVYFVRDFGVRHVDLFLANYSLVDTGQTTQVAGVSCERIEVARRVSPERKYVLDVDTTTGMVLSSREEMLDGTLLTLVVYESIDYTPDFTGVIWNSPVNNEQDLVQGSPEALLDLGFNPPAPKVLPDGWQQIGLAKLVDFTNGRVWARLTYSDGVEQIFFIVAKGDGPSHQLKNPPPGTPPSHPDRVRKMAIGTWTLLEADLAQGQAMVLGRAPDGVLEDTIQSAFY